MLYHVRRTPEEGEDEVFNMVMSQLAARDYASTQAALDGFILTEVTAAEVDNMRQVRVAESSKSQNLSHILAVVGPAI